MSANDLPPVGSGSPAPAVERLWRGGRTLAQGNYPGLRPATAVKDGVRVDTDVAVPMRDGIRIYTDIYRPAAGTGFPAIIAWSGYGKHDTGPGVFDHFPNRTMVPPGVPSTWAKWEAPDPDYWCRHGYAVVNPDARGSFMSEGRFFTVGGTEADDMHDLIEWLARQQWCNGKVGMSGNSWLAQSQWFAAATQPEHLAAIAPWEGWSDLYRENVAPGGITTEPVNWMDFVWSGLHSQTAVEDCPAMASKYPLWNEYWAEKQAQHARCQVPAYVVASWQSRLHARGSLEGFKQLGTPDKWLRIHDGWEWPDYYDPANMEELRRFFDRYLKGIDNGWEQTPRVRVELMDQPRQARQAPSRQYREEDTWPFARTRYEPLFLDAAASAMSPTPVDASAQVEYEAVTGSAHFDYTFAEDTELSGHMALRLWVQARNADDMDLFLVAQKHDQAGQHANFKVYGIGWDAEPARGFLRVSHRELDKKRSTPQQPWHTHRTEQLLAADEIVPVEIEFWPMGCLWRRGETIRIVVAGHPLLHAGGPVGGEALRSSRNRGTHVIWTGGQYDSRLIIPHTPSA